MATASGRAARRLALLVLLPLAIPSDVSAATITNGGFETNTLGGWTVDNAGGGNWYTYSGNTTPLTATSISAPPEGTFGAVTDQMSPGRHLLYQDVALEAGATHTLSLFVYYGKSGAGPFSTPSTLDHTVVPNEQYRIDVMSPSAPVASVVPGDVLLPVFRTDVGEPASLGPTPITADLSPWNGMTVRLRFAEVDNQAPLRAAVDDVRITTTALCQGRPVTMFGTNDSDTLVGTSGADVILGNAGDDFIKTGAGRDRVCADDGDDVVSGGSGNDRIDGGDGADELKGKAGNDLLLGKHDDDSLNGGAGEDTCKGGTQKDDLTKCERGHA